MIRFRHLPRAATVWKNTLSLLKPLPREMSDESVHPMAEKGFDKLTSKIYERSRPSYTKESVNFLLDKLDIPHQDPSSDQPLRILELGTGTGKFTRILQEALHGSKVQILASEPVLSMREEFSNNIPDIEIKDFSADHIDLPSCSVHAVVAAQCFHWFANDKSISEIQRILVPGGKLGLVWNARDHSIPWVKEMDDEILLPCYEQSNTPNEQSGAWKKVLSASGKFGPIEEDETTFKIEQTFNFDEFVNRIMSISVIAVKSEKEKQIVIDQIKLILSKHNELEKDILTLPYTVKVYWCERT